MIILQAIIVVVALLALRRVLETSPGRLTFAPAQLVRASIIVATTFSLIVVLSGLGVVPAGESGVVTRLGAVSSGIRHEGLYAVIPLIEQVHVVDTKPHKEVLENTEAVTSDRQQVHTSVALIVQVDPATVDQTYRNYRDTIIDQVVMPKFQEAVKTVTARYDAKTQVQNRALVQSEMLAYVQHELTGKGVVIGPGALSIINFSYNDDYQKAIEETAVAQQNLVKAEAQLKVNQIEAQQKIATARGEAESQALLARTINANSLQYEFYKHWDGRLPTVVGASSGNILDVSALLAAGNKTR